MSHPYRVGDRVTVRELLEVWIDDRTYWFPPGDEWTVRAVRAGGVQLCGVWLPVRFVKPLEDQP